MRETIPFFVSPSPFMSYFGETVALAVAFSWTFTALFFEFATKRIGTLNVNLLRLLFAFVILTVLLGCVTGHFLPFGANPQAWAWLALSGLVGFVFGDICLFYSYTLISAQYAQLLMTLAPAFAAFSAWLILGEQLSAKIALGMSVTLVGIAISVLTRKKNDAHGTAENRTDTQDVADVQTRGLSLKISPKGILIGVGAALGQGLGIVLSKQGMLHFQETAEASYLRFMPFAATQIRIISGIVGFVCVILLLRGGRSFTAALGQRKAVGATLAGSIFGPVIGVSLSLLAVMHTNAAVASTIMATTPILILLPYALIYKRRITWPEILGAVVSVIGVSLFF